MRDFLLAPSASFDEPIEMLKACHERIRRQCATLEKLVEHLPVHGADVQAQQAATNVMRYFDTAGRNHHADEEENLFPLLVQMSEAAQDNLGERIASLLAEHQVLDRNWAALRPLLADIAAGRPAPLGRPQVDAFASAYRQHTAREEAEILPYAEQHLRPEQVRALSDAMVARRTVK